MRVSCPSLALLRRCYRRGYRALTPRSSPGLSRGPNGIASGLCRPTIPRHRPQHPAMGPRNKSGDDRREGAPGMNAERRASAMNVERRLRGGGREVVRERRDGRKRRLSSAPSAPRPHRLALFGEGAGAFLGVFAQIDRGEQVVGGATASRKDSNVSSWRAGRWRAAVRAEQRRSEYHNWAPSHARGNDHGDLSFFGCNPVPNPDSIDYNIYFIQINTSHQDALRS